MTQLLTISLFALLASLTPKVTDNLEGAAKGTPNNAYQTMLQTEAQKNFYLALDEMAKSPEFSTGIYEHEIFPATSFLKEGDIISYLEGDAHLLKEFGAAKEAYYYDHPEIFYVDSDAISLSIGIKGERYHVSIGTGRRESYALPQGFGNEVLLKTAKTELESLVSDFSSLHNLKAPQDKVKAALDVVKAKATYGFAAEDPALSPHIRSSYGALIKGKAVCEGYAKAMQLLLDSVNVPNVLTNGYLLSNEGNYEPHLYNKVQLDGNWYLVDATQCDTNSNEAAFLLGAEESSPEYLEDPIIGSSGFKFATPALHNVTYGQNELPVKTALSTENGKKEFRAELSVDAKNSTALQQEGKYLGVSYSTQSSSRDAIVWQPYASLYHMLKMESGAVTEQADSTLFRDWGSTPFLKFALIEGEPDDPVYGTYQNPKILSSSRIYENTAYEGAKAAPFPSKVNPSNKTRLDIHSRYTMEITYDEPLVKEDPNVPLGIQVDTPHHVKDTEYSLEDVRFEEKTNTLRFEFRPSKMFLHNKEPYHFTPTNLVGKESKAAPKAVTYVFAYREYVCNKILPGGQLYMDVFGAPSLLDSSDLSLEGWKIGEDPLPSSMRSQLALVSTSIGKEDGNVMSEAIGENIFSSSTYEITLSACGIPATIPSGSYMKVSFGFPEGYDANMAGTTFKLYHFKRDAKGNIDPTSAEAIPCVITPHGIVAEIPSFSPFMLIETRKGENEPNSYYARRSSGKGKVSFKETGRESALIPAGTLPTLLLEPENGYRVSYALHNGEFLDISNPEVHLLKEHASGKNVIEVGFVSETKLAREEASGIRNLDGTFLSSLKGIDTLDQTSKIILWTIIPILSVIAVFALIFWIVEMRKKRD